MASSLGVHPHESHIFISFFNSTPKLIWQNCNLHLADKQGAKEAVLTVFFSPSTRPSRAINSQSLYSLQTLPVLLTTFIALRPAILRNNRRQKDG